LQQISEKTEDFWSGPVYWTNNFLNENPFFVDDEALWNSGYSIERFDTPFRIQECREGQIQFSHKRRHCFLSGGINTDCQNFEVFTLETVIKFLHGRHFIPTGGAPSGPDIDKHHLASEIR
jgi:hypothetical protein